MQPTVVAGKNSSYSLASTGGGLIFLAGHVGSDEQGKGVDAEFGVQVRRALTRLLNTLGAAGAQPSALLKVNVFLADKNDFDEFNAIYRELFAEPRPARTTIEAPLGHGWRFEVDAIALAPAPADATVA